MSEKFGLDVDGCLFNFFTSFSEYMEIKHNITFDEQNHNKFRFDFDNISSNQIHEYIKDSIMNWNVYVYPYVRESIEELHKMGFEFTVITARCKEVYQKTFDDLKTLVFGDIPFELISEEKKYNPIFRLGIRYFYEDRFKNINEIGNYLKYVFCPIRNHNSGREFKVNNVIRVNDMREIVNFFKF